MLRMNLRAQEIHAQHNEKSRQLRTETEQRQQELFALVPGGEEAYRSGVVARGPEELGAKVEAAEAAVAAAEAAEWAHQTNQPDPVRNYRVLSLDGSVEYGHFTADYVVAKNEARRIAWEKDQVNQYSLEEQLPDGSWVPFELGRDGLAQ